MILFKQDKKRSLNQPKKNMKSFNPDDYTEEELKDIYRKDEKYLKGLIEESRKKIEEEQKWLEANKEELKWVQSELKRLYS